MYINKKVIPIDIEIFQNTDKSTKYSLHLILCDDIQIMAVWRESIPLFS